MSNNTRKAAAVFTVLCMLLASGGCAGPDAQTSSAGGGNAADPSSAASPSEEQQTLEVAMFEGGYAGYWEGFIERFQKDHPNVEIKSEISPKIDESLRPRFMSDDVPDFVASNISTTLDPRILAQEGQVMDLTDFFAGATYEGEALEGVFWDGIMDFCKQDGKIVFAPQNVSFNGVMYNAKLLKDLGVETPKTWDDLMEIGAVIEESGNSDISLFTYAGIYPSYYTDAAFYTTVSSGARGIEAFEDIESNKAGAWTSPEAVKAFGYIQTMAEKGYIRPGTIAMDHTQSQQDFLTGKVAFIPNGSWLEGEMSSVEPVNFEWGFIPTLLLEEDGTSYLNGGIEVMFIPQNAKNPEMAKEFLKAYYTEENVKTYAKDCGGIVPINGVYDVIGEYMTESFKVILNARDETNSVFHVFKVPTDYAAVVDEFNNQITNVVSLQISAEDALKSVDAKAQEVGTN